MFSVPLLPLKDGSLQQGEKSKQLHKPESFIQPLLFGRAEHGAQGPEQAGAVRFLLYGGKQGQKLHHGRKKLPLLGQKAGSVFRPGKKSGR